MVSAPCGTKLMFYAATWIECGMVQPQACTHDVCLARRSIDAHFNHSHDLKHKQNCQNVEQPWKQLQGSPALFLSRLAATVTPISFCITSILRGFIKVLVGIGSRSITIVRVKSLKLYAFGFYVHPNSLCEKLGPKYASVPISELNSRQEFFEDLLREDINMTVRLVVNCNGLKINTVRDAFEKSLRARLLKMNPNTDYHCLRAFGSHFTSDIPIPAGTTIDFRRTADGELITEIEGKQIGAVHSKDLCRAFFDMYIGDVPVSVHVKHEIATNVAGIMRRC